MRFHGRKEQSLSDPKSCLPRKGAPSLGEGASCGLDVWFSICHDDGLFEHAAGRMITMKFWRTALALAPVMTMGSLLTGCGVDHAPRHRAMLANPASVYCEKQGGKLEIRHEKDGDVGYCHLAYGRVVEEWVLYRAAHKKDAAK